MCKARIAGIERAFCRHPLRSRPIAGRERVAG